MALGLAVTLFVAAAALVYIAAPLFRGEAGEAERTSHALSEARELQSRRDMLVGALTDLEDDRATDKIDQADYEQLRARLSAEALEVLRRLDALEGGREQALEAERRFGHGPAG